MPWLSIKEELFMRNKITLTIIATAVLLIGVISFIIIEKDRNSDNIIEKDRNSDNNEASWSQENSDIDWDKLDEVSLKYSYDKESSKKIYESLNDQERELQEFTAQYVGYKNLSKEQTEALENVIKEEKEACGGGDWLRYPYRRMAAIGEADPSDKLTMNDVNVIKQKIKEGYTIESVKKYLRLRHPYYDCLVGVNSIQVNYEIEGGGGLSIGSDWDSIEYITSEGREKIA